MLETDPIDWLRDSSGDLVIPMQHATGAIGVGQNVQLRLRMIKGEWFLDLDVGPPWFPGAGVSEDEAILGQRFVPARARAAVVDALDGTPGLGSITSIEITFDGPTRVMSITVEATTLFGNTIQETAEVTV